MSSSTGYENKINPMPIREALAGTGRPKLLGLTLDDYIKAFFGGNAIVAIVVLFLIMVLLFSEGLGFLPQNHFNITVYRQAGLEYVDYVRKNTDDFAVITRYLNNVRSTQLKGLMAEGKTFEQATAALAQFDGFKEKFEEQIDPLRSVLSDMTEIASDIKTRVLVNEDLKEEVKLLESGANRAKDAAQREDLKRQVEVKRSQIKTFDFPREVAALREMLPQIVESNQALLAGLKELKASIPKLPFGGDQAKFDRLSTWFVEFEAQVIASEQEMKVWDPMVPIPFSKSITSFLFGSRWLTASFWQDWYGVVPLFIGSLTISIIALVIAVPFGIGAAIYVNQVANFREQALIKPYIEFIAAIPSVVLGFFGIAVLGEFLRMVSGVSFMQWVPGFPMSERLTMLTAGCLLGLMAVPTIFTLAEDALNNVPRSFTEASLALGATKWQTIIRILVPASLSGIISAVLLGLGRVIGETMVVLLCAGNRIQIPDFSQGIGIIVQPAHTMTGIIAQEMGEVVKGSIHYRALFMVGIVLFLIALLINFLAQQIVRKYKISIG